MILRFLKAFETGKPLISLVPLEVALKLTPMLEYFGTSWQIEVKRLEFSEVFLQFYLHILLIINILVSQVL